MFRSCSSQSNFVFNPRKDARPSRFSGPRTSRKAQASDGITVVFEVTGATRRTIPVEVQDQRARNLDDILNSPTVRLIMDMDTFSSLACGRIPLDEVQANNGVQIEGDQQPGQRVQEQMNIMV